MLWGGGNCKNEARFDENKKRFDGRENAKRFGKNSARFDSSAISARFSDKNRKLIGINFFGSGGVRYFSLESWREAVESLAREFEAHNFIVFCPPNREVERFFAPNVAIFKNNHDLLNLVAMSARLNALISVDTGNIHIADNLQIPTIGIYTRKMAKKWRGGTYGAKFIQFVVRSNESDLARKNRLLAFLRENIPNILCVKSQNLTKKIK